MTTTARERYAVAKAHQDVDNQRKRVDPPLFTVTTARLRTLLGISQEQMSRDLATLGFGKFSSAYISMIESGKRVPDEALASAIYTLLVAYIERTKK